MAKTATSKLQVVVDEAYWEKETEPRHAEAEKVRALATRVAIATHSELENAAECLLDIKEKVKEVEAEKAKAVDPIKAGLKVIDGWFKRILVPYTEAEAELKGKIAAYHVECEAARDKQMLDAQKVAKVDPKKARLLIASAEEKLAPTVAGVSFRGKFGWEVVDAGELPDEYWKRVPDEAKIDALVQANGLHANIPGIVVTDERSVAVTPGRRVK